MDVLSLNIPPCCHISLSYTLAFEIKTIHQRIPITRSHTSRCHYCHYCNVDFELFHNVTCYTHSLLSCIHVNVVDCLNITCTLVAPCMILERLECIKIQFIKFELFTKDENSDILVSHFLRVSLWWLCMHDKKKLKQNIIFDELNDEFFISLTKCCAYSIPTIIFFYAFWCMS